MTWLVYVLAIGFWVLCACAVVCLIVLTFDKCFKRERETFVHMVAETVREEIEKAENNS